MRGKTRVRERERKKRLGLERGGLKTGMGVFWKGLTTKREVSKREERERER
jgi:hypothetical protein